MVCFTLYAAGWTRSIGDPVAAVNGYEYVSHVSWLFLLISTCVLLVLANAGYWTRNRLWTMWATFIYFAVFAALRYFGLEPSVFEFRKEHGLSDASFTAKPFLAVILILAMAAIVFANQLILIRLRAKAYPEPKSTIDSETDKDISD